VPARPAANPYARQLDGLRAGAVAAVAWSHWLPAFQFGLPLGAGVHLFFVLSGFLITRILLDLRHAPDRGAAIGRFFVRRALRLFPAFYVVLALAWLADVPLAAETWRWHAAYLSNVYIARQATWQGHLSHFWSLAVEQQFYVIWPWVVVWAPKRWLVPSLVAATLVGPAAHLLAASRGLAEPFWALVPGGSADSLGLGALVAVSMTGASTTLGRLRHWQWAAVAAAVVWLTIALVEVTTGAPLPLLAARQLVQGIVFAWIVAAAVDGLPGVTGRILSNRIVVAIGRISYGVYLVHAFAPLVVDAAARRVGLAPIPQWSPFVRAAAAGAVTLVLATGLWHLVEAPAHRLKARM
jgi:peptidoglycan/LPS O-acetylase OafA/YrhL